jgi:hypothetical protein
MDRRCEREKKSADLLIAVRVLKNQSPSQINSVLVLKLDISLPRFFSSHQRCFSIKTSHQNLWPLESIHWLTKHWENLLSWWCLPETQA